jgi:hypothetical protein
MSEKETYQVVLVCNNCGYRQSNLADIPKGMKIWPAVNEKSCEFCGCTGTLTRSPRFI